MPDLFVSKDKNKVSEKTHSTKESVADESFNEEEATKLHEMKTGEIKYPKSERERMLLPGHSINPLAAFNYFPSKLDFINKDPEEEVILMLRRHPITNIKWILVAVAMIMLPPFVSILPFLDALPGKFFILLILAWYMITLSYIFEHFLNWYFSLCIITDERIFDVDFYNLIYRKITDAEIEEIQEVTVKIGGGLRTVFNYGDVLIQTASEIPEIVYEDVPTPDRVAKVLRELQVQEEVEKIEGRVR